MGIHRCTWRQCADIWTLSKELLRAKANPLLTMTNPEIDFLALDTAAHEGRSEVVRELIQQVRIQGWGGSNGGVRALNMASRQQHVDTMAVLVDAGVVDTGVALHNAAGCRREAAVKFLLQRRELERSPTGLVGYVNWRDSTGATPLLNGLDVLESNERVLCLISPKVVQLLIDAGADTSSPARVTRRRAVYFDGTPLAFTQLLPP